MIDQRQLLASLGPKLHRLAAGFFTGDEQRHTPDLAQEGWIAVWRALPTVPVHLLRDADALEGWCIGVARNRMRNWIRDELSAPRRGSRATVPASDVIVDLVEALSGSLTLQTIDQAYHDGRVAAALDALPPRQREYVVARFWHGISTTELQKTFSPRTWQQARRRLELALTT